MRTLQVYVKEDVEGSSVEEKTYQFITEAYEESGYEETPEEVKRRFRFIGSEVNFGTAKVPLEWKVDIEGEDSDINDLEDIINEIG